MSEEEKRKQKELELSASNMYYKYIIDFTRVELLALSKVACNLTFSKPLNKITKAELIQKIAESDITIFKNTTHKYFFKEVNSTLKYVPTFPQDENPFVPQRKAKKGNTIDVDSVVASYVQAAFENQQFENSDALDLTLMGEEDDEPTAIPKPASPSPKDSQKLSSDTEETEFHTPKTDNTAKSKSSKQKTSTPSGKTAPPPKMPDFESHRFQHSDQEDLIQQLISKVESLEKSQNLSSRFDHDKSLNYKTKIKFDPEAPIEDFIQGVEAYGRANGVVDAQKYIGVAQAAMSITTEGMQLQSSIEAQDLTSWQTYRERLKEITGHSREYYEDEFSQFQIGDRRPGQALAALTLSYKRARLYGNDELTEKDKKQICDQFVRGLKNPLKGFVSTQLPNLDFRSLGAYAERVMRGFELNKSTVAALPIDHGIVSEKPAVQSTTEKALLNAIEELKKQMPAQRGYKHSRGHSLFDTKKLAGYCYRHHVQKNCKNDPCHYSHEKASGDVSKYIDSLIAERKNKQ